MKRIVALFLSLLLCFSSAICVSAENAVLEKESVLESLFDADIATIRHAINSKSVSCEELTRYYLYRIQRYNSKYNCFISLCSDALETAKARDEALAKGENKGILFGVPIVIKDNMDLAGYYTTNGHKTDELSISETTADVVRYLLSEGAVIIGKTNMSTDAQDARVSTSLIAGETKNAYNIGLASGGSSGGTAVAVSLNFATAGLGTDTNSSLRIPAVLNGCVSLRSTFGLIPINGIIKLNGSRDVAGAITKTVYDQAIMMDVLTRGVYKYTANLDKNALNGMRIGILSELTYPIENLADYDKSTLSEKSWQELIDRSKASNFDTEVLTAFENAVKELENCGAEVVTVSMPELFNLSDKTFRYSNGSYKDALYDDFKRLLEEDEIDAVIYPTYSSTPLKSGYDTNGKYWNAWSQVFINNCRTLSPSARLPEMSVIIGQHSSGAGIGMEIASLKNNEQLLLNIAYSYTTKYDHRITPQDVPHIQGSLTEPLTLKFFEKVSTEIETPLEEPLTEVLTETTTVVAPTETTSETQTSISDNVDTSPSLTSQYKTILAIVIIILALSSTLVITIISINKKR